MTKILVLLDDNEEKHLAEHLTEAAKLGYGNNINKCIVENVTNGWWHHFMQWQSHAVVPSLW